MRAVKTAIDVDDAENIMQISSRYIKLIKNTLNKHLYYITHWATRAPHDTSDPTFLYVLNIYDTYINESSYVNHIVRLVSKSCLNYRVF
jgi:hypothetical protein